jgi:hypothetical protein
MTNYAPPQWVPVSAAPTPKRGTRMTRWRVFLGMVSMVAGFLIPLPILGLVFCIVGLCRGTDIPGRAAVGVVCAWSGLTFWGGFIAVCIWSMRVNYA